MVEGPGLTEQVCSTSVKGYLFKIMNAFLKKMGFSEGDKVLITHVDDMGFCHAALATICHWVT